MTIPIKLCGVVTGTVSIPSLDITVAQLGTTINRLRGHSDDDAVKLLARGRVLSDPLRTLDSYGVAAGAKVVVMAGPPPGSQPGGASTPEAPATDASRNGDGLLLDRLVAAVDKVCSRTAQDGLQRHQLVLENQAGARVELSADARKGLSMGMVLHEQGKAAMAAGELPKALRLLELSEQAYSVVSMDAVGAIDNVALMLVDLVWCCFKLQDRDKLAISGARLDRARAELESAHGPDLSRLRRLQGGFCPEVATYVRLDLLRGICCSYNGDATQALSLLRRAQASLQKLQVVEASLLALMEMGFSAKLATRALRFCGNDVAQAIEFCFAQQAAAADRAARKARSAEQRQLQRRLGRTDGGKWVDVEALESLEAMGFAQLLASEALKRADNNLQSALDMLGSELTRGALEDAAMGAAGRQGAAAPAAAAPPDTSAAPSVDAASPAPHGTATAPEEAAGVSCPAGADQGALDTLLEGGYRKYYARWALEKTGGDVDKARAALEAWGPKTRRQAAPAGQESPSPVEAESDDELDWEAEGEVVQQLESASRDPLAAYDLDTSEEAAALDRALCELQLQMSAQPGHA